jgi:hypothetical protein
MKRFVVDLRVSKSTSARIIVSYTAIGADFTDAVIAAKNEASKSFRRIDGIASVYPTSVHRGKIHAGEARQL